MIGRALRGLCLMMALAFACVAASAQSLDNWNGPDKKLHFGVSAMFGVAARSQWPDAPVKAFAWALAPGLVKEVLDAQKGGTGFSFKDLAADALGALAGVAMTGLFVTLDRVEYRTRF